MSLVFVGVGFMAFLAATTLAIDVGMFMTARAARRRTPPTPARSRAPPRSSSTTTTIGRAGGPAVRARSPRARTNKVMGGSVSVMPAT